MDGFYKDLMTDLPRVEAGFIHPLDGTGPRLVAECRRALTRRCRSQNYRKMCGLKGYVVDVNR